MLATSHSSPPWEGILTQIRPPTLQSNLKSSTSLPPRTTLPPCPLVKLSILDSPPPKFMSRNRLRGPLHKLPLRRCPTKIQRHLLLLVLRSKLSRFSGRIGCFPSSLTLPLAETDIPLLLRLKTPIPLLCQNSYPPPGEGLLLSPTLERLPILGSEKRIPVPFPCLYYLPLFKMKFFS